MASSSSSSSSSQRFLQVENKNTNTNTNTNKKGKLLMKIRINSKNKNTNKNKNKNIQNYNENSNQNYNKNINYNKNNNDNEIKRKFYRKVEYANEILANDIFKQGINLVILRRQKGYQKIYERTFNTNVDPVESDTLACTIRDAGYDKIIILTGIGKWMGSMTPRLVKEVKQIGGPDLNRLVSIDSEDNSLVDHAFILVGRKGLCRYNGIFKIKNYDISRDLKDFFHDLSSDPNDCYFENVNFENMKNSHSGTLFFHQIDLRLTLNFANDNRFSYKAPIITSVTPTQGPISGNQKITIFGHNFGKSILDIKEILVRGVVCKYIEFISSNTLTCYTGKSSIMGCGLGNIVIKLVCGLSSPVNTCNMYNYNPKLPSIKLDMKAINARSNLPDSDMYIAEASNDPSPNPFEPRTTSPIFSMSNPIVSSQMRRSEIILPIISFKEKNLKIKMSNLNKKDDENCIENDKVKLDKGDLMILNGLKEKIDKYNYEDDHLPRDKVDNLVTDNFNNLYVHADKSAFNRNNDGFNKQRYRNIKSQIK
jgi:hypothetical protein